MKRNGVLALLALAAAAALSAVAQMPDMPLGKWWKQPRVVEALKLSADQQERLEGIFSKNRKAFVDLKADVDRRTIDLEDVLGTRDADPKKVAAASEALEQAKARLGKARTMMVYEMKTVLTEEQWGKIEARRDEWRRQLMNEKRRPMREGRPMRPGRLGAAGVPDAPAEPPEPRE